MKKISIILLICLVINLFCGIPAFAENDGKLLLNYKMLELNKGETEKIKASYSDMTEPLNITFQTADENVAAVDGDGTVTAADAGITKITVSDGVTAAEISVVVNDYKGLGLDNTDISLTVGQEFKLNALLSEELEGKAVKWETEKSSVAAVSNGTVVGVGNGVTNIKASLEENPEVFALCKVAVGTLSQDLYTFVTADKEPYPLWSAVWVLRGGSDFKKMTSTDGAKWSEKNINGWVSAYEMAVGKDYNGNDLEFGRMYHAPASGRVAIEIANMNSLVNESANRNEKASGEYLKLSLDIVARGEVAKSFIMDTPQNSEGGYYRNVSYNGAEEDKESETSNSLTSSKSMKNEIGVVELDVVKGEEIVFIPRRIEGSSTFQFSTWNGGFSVRYISTDSVTGIKEAADTVSLKSGEIADISAKISGRGVSGEVIKYRSSDESIVSVSDNGMVKANAQGTAKVYFSNENGDVQGYTEINVLPGGFYAGEAFCTVSGDKKTADVSFDFTSSAAAKLVPVFIARDKYGRPIKLSEGELLDIAENAVTSISGENISIAGAESIDVYLINEDKTLVVFEKSIEINK